MTTLVVHEWLEPRGGSERVVDAMLDAFPGADLVALWNDAPEKYHNVQESWIACTPLRRHKALALPFEPATWRHIGVSSDPDFALVSSHLFAHHVDIRRVDGGRVPKFVYVHTPARYIWEPDLDRRGSSPIAQVAASFLKPLDRRRAQEATKIAANSKFVQERVLRTWERQSDVIYPPVDVDEILAGADLAAQMPSADSMVLEALPSTFILGASRFVQYKRLDWVVRAGDRLGLPVVIAGSGPDGPRLRALAAEAAVPVIFVPNPPTPVLHELYRRAAVFVFPPIEDFGIMPVEAQAAGTPVVTTSVGGARETFKEGVSGVAAKEDCIEELAMAVEVALGLPRFDAIKAVSMYSKDRFIRDLRRWITE